MRQKQRNILEVLDVSGKLSNRDKLAECYNNIGAALYKVECHDETFLYYLYALALRQELDCAGQLGNRERLAFSCDKR